MRTHRPILDVASGNLMVLIARHQDSPCPTAGEIVEWTAVPRRRLAAWLEELQARGLIEIEYSAGKPPRRRRLRAVGGVWTGWTQRGPGLHAGSRRERAAAARIRRRQRKQAEEQAEEQS
jgi:hypothetical protein